MAGILYINNAGSLGKLPEETPGQLINNKLIMSPSPIFINQVILGEYILSTSFDPTRN